MVACDFKVKASSKVESERNPGPFFNKCLKSFLTLVSLALKGGRLEAALCWPNSSHFDLSLFFTSLPRCGGKEPIAAYDERKQQQQQQQHPNSGSFLQQFSGSSLRGETTKKDGLSKPSQGHHHTQYSILVLLMSYDKGLEIKVIARYVKKQVRISQWCFRVGPGRLSP